MFITHLLLPAIGWANGLAMLCECVCVCVCMSVFSGGGVGGGE